MSSLYTSNLSSYSSESVSSSFSTTFSSFPYVSILIFIFSYSVVSIPKCPSLKILDFLRFPSCPPENFACRLKALRSTNLFIMSSNILYPSDESKTPSKAPSSRTLERSACITICFSSSAIMLSLSSLFFFSSAVMFASSPSNSRRLFSSINFFICSSLSIVRSLALFNPEPNPTFVPGLAGLAGCCFCFSG